MSKNETLVAYDGLLSPNPVKRSGETFFFRVRDMQTAPGSQAKVIGSTPAEGPRHGVLPPFHSGLG